MTPAWLVRRLRLRGWTRDSVLSQRDPVPGQELRLSLETGGHELKLPASSAAAGERPHFRGEREQKAKGAPVLGTPALPAGHQFCLHVPMNSLFCLKRFELRSLSFTAERSPMDTHTTAVTILARERNSGGRTGRPRVTRTSLGKTTDDKTNSGFPPRFRKSSD